MARRAAAQQGRHGSYISYAAIVLSIAAMILAGIDYTHVNTIYINRTVYVNGTSGPNVTLTHYNITGSLITPVYYLPSYPPINSSDPPGNTLNGLNAQLTPSQLAVLNDAPNSYFETAGQMYLQNNLTNTVGTAAGPVPVFMLNGKPTVIYLGSTTCIFCGENRWAMALALSRFGNFSTLFMGYSALQDGDVPSIFWAPASYGTAHMDMGSFYSSNLINFIAFEDSYPITGGFALETLAQMQQQVNATGNQAYISAFDYILQINNFKGTPYTIWGTYQVNGADAVVFGNNTQTAPAPLNLWTHDQVFSLLKTPNSQFAWSEYAAADLYVAMICRSLENSAPACQLPSIQQIQQRNGY